MCVFQFVQQMEAMNINKANQFALQPMNHFDMSNNDSKNQPQNNFGQSLAATNFWQ